MNILLNGYFDKNLGDDIMHKMIVEAFSEHKFYIYSTQREMLSHLEEYDNVYIDTPCDKIDVFLNVIGTGFMYSGKRAKVEKLINILTDKRRDYKKAALINCSLENFDSKLAKRFANSDLKHYNLITCRDSISYNYLCSNFKKARVMCFPDMVFASGLQRNFPLTGEGLLGVSPVRRLYSSENHSYYTELSLMCDSFIEKNDKNVLLFAFDNGLENDTSAVLSVRGMMKHPDRAEIVIYGGNPYDTIKNMRRCSIFVGSRFHSIVLATLLNIKCLAIYDNEKLKRLCSERRISSVTKSEFNGSLFESYINNCDNALNIHAEANGHINALREFLYE